MTDISRTIAEAVAARSDRIVSTLCDLVRFPSIVMSDPTQAGPGERDCQLYLQDRLRALGFETDLWEPDGPALYAAYEGCPGANKGRTFGGRPNLGGTLSGTGGGRSLMLTGHIDVVVKPALMGFPADLTIRLRGLGSRTRIDIRCVSRTPWQEQPGANAARVEALAGEIEDAADRG